MRIRILQFAEAFLQVIIPQLESLRERVAVCPDCGRNRYTGAPCVNNGVSR
jgi:hypothetical protein